MNAAREINRKEDEQEERRKGEAFNRIACELVEGVQAQEREAAAEEEDTRRLAEEAKIDGLWIFRRTAIRETVTVICAVLKDIEKSIGRKLSARDVISMRQLADGYNRLEIATADIERDGYYIETARGALVLHPAHKLKADAMADCMSIMKQYGLTMYARDRIKAFGGEDGGDIGGFDLGDTNFDD
jgi:P27 family predicted phage terminase small subunit